MARLLAPETALVFAGVCCLACAGATLATVLLGLVGLGGLLFASLLAASAAGSAVLVLLSGLCAAASCGAAVAGICVSTAAHVCGALWAAGLQFKDGPHAVAESQGGGSSGSSSTGQQHECQPAGPALPVSRHAAVVEDEKDLVFSAEEAAAIADAAVAALRCGRARGGGNRSSLGSRDAAAWGEVEAKVEEQVQQTLGGGAPGQEELKAVGASEDQACGPAQKGSASTLEEAEHKPVPVAVVEVDVPATPAPAAAPLPAAAAASPTTPALGTPELPPQHASNTPPATPQPLGVEATSQGQVQAATAADVAHGCSLSPTEAAGEAAEASGEASAALARVASTPGLADVARQAQVCSPLPHLLPLPRTLLHEILAPGCLLPAVALRPTMSLLPCCAMHPLAQPGDFLCERLPGTVCSECGRTSGSCSPATATSPLTSQGSSSNINSCGSSADGSSSAGQQQRQGQQLVSALGAAACMEVSSSGSNSILGEEEDTEAEAEGLAAATGSVRAGFGMGRGAQVARVEDEEFEVGVDHGGALMVRPEPRPSWDGVATVLAADCGVGSVRRVLLAQEQEEGEGNAEADDDWGVYLPMPPQPADAASHR